MKKIEIDSQELKDLRSELKEEHDWRVRLHGEVEDLKESDSRRRLAHNLLVTERNELATRIQQINIIVQSLGFDVAPITL